MRDPEVLVCFRPSGGEAYVLPGTRLVEAAAEAGHCFGEPLRRRRALRQMPGARRRRAPASRRPPNATNFRPRNFGPAGGWRASRRSPGRWRSRFRPLRCAAAEHQILVHAVGDGNAVRKLFSGSEAIYATAAARPRRLHCRPAAVGAGNRGRTTGNPDFAAARTSGPATSGQLPRHRRA